MTGIPASSGPGLTSETSSLTEREGVEVGGKTEKEGEEVEKKTERDGGEVEKKTDKEGWETEGKAAMVDKGEQRQRREGGERSFPDSTHNSGETQRDKSSGDEETNAIAKDSDSNHNIAMATEGAHVMQDNLDKTSSDIDAPKLETAVEGVGVGCHPETTEGGEVPQREPIEDEHEWEYRHTAAPTRSSLATDSFTIGDGRFNVYHQTWDPDKLGEDDIGKEVTTETSEEQAKIEARELAAYR